MGMPPDGSTAPLFSQMGLAGVLETFGGALLLLGLFTRPVAFVVAGEMAVAYFQVSAPLSFWPIVNGGVATVLFCFLWLYLSAAGAGPWSLDAWRAGSPAPHPGTERHGEPDGGDAGRPTGGSPKFGPREATKEISPTR